MHHPPRTLVAVIAAVGALPGATPAHAASSKIDTIERQLLEQINQYRASHGLSALKLYAKLSKAADSHSADMLRHGYFSHTDRKGRTAGKRIRAYGTKAQRTGENLGAVTGSVDQEVAALMDYWRKSKPHRTNMLKRSYTRVGLGRRAGTYRGKHVIMYTVDFASAR